MDAEHLDDGDSGAQVPFVREETPVPLEFASDEGAARSFEDDEDNTVSMPQALAPGDDDGRSFEAAADDDQLAPAVDDDELSAVHAGATRAYAFFHNAVPDSISVAEVERSSAGVQGWFDHHLSISKGKEADQEYLMLLSFLQRDPDGSKCAAMSDCSDPRRLLTVGREHELRVAEAHEAVLQSAAAHAAPIVSLDEPSVGVTVPLAELHEEGPSSDDVLHRDPVYKNLCAQGFRVQL